MHEQSPAPHLHTDSTEQAHDASPSGLSRRTVLQASTVAGAAAAAVGVVAAQPAAAHAPEAGQAATTVPSAGLLTGDKVNEGDRLTTAQGTRLSSDSDTLRAGARGPALLEDFHFREKIMHFDHERTPERVVHARGAGAHGTFVLSKSLARFTTAKVLTEVGAKVPVFVRFSTVNGSRGSADVVRDARGFATKFYTSEGIWDLVGNNIPVFFIQDAIKFPDLVHSFKPQPAKEMPQGATAHDSFWDFVGLSPETLHMVMWAMSDRAIPRSYRMMDGFGVHTFRLVDAKGVGTFVKFHWKAKLGVHSVVWDEAVKINGADPDFHRRDLAEAIASGTGPQYDLAVQLVAEKDVARLGVDVLDPTKLWPEEVAPLQVVGTMTLDKNPDNFFAETDQVAFHPGHLVAGIDVTDDPLLQGRMFSYLDTQLNRFNSANFSQLPINRPRSSVNTFEQDGYMRFAARPGDVNYNPNSRGDAPKVSSAAEGGFVSYREPVSGAKVRERPASFNDYYTQARMFYISLTAPEQLHVAQAFAFELSKVEAQPIRERILGHLARIDTGLTKAVATALGLPAPAGQVVSARPSPSLSQERTPKAAATRKVAILVADGVDGGDVAAMATALKGAGATAVVVGPRLGTIRATGGSVTATQTFTSTAPVLYDAVYVASGKESVTTITALGAAKAYVLQAFKHFKTVGGSGDAKAFVTSLVGAQTAPGLVLGDGAGAIASAFVAGLTQDRHWDRKGTEAIA
ncbi:catalase [Arsenicicoccus dermatophilus]|uniref:catalase n=1 Tax=Arsenicicoccus dermatophilus TaxID=1076331 RepID=UPI0039173B77